MRVIVTGGAGFIGSHLVDALVERGDEVHVLDNLSTGKESNVAAGAVLHRRDLREPIGDLFDERPAGDVLPPRGAGRRSACPSSSRSSTPRSTCSGPCALLEAAARHGTQLVFSSTGGAIYGECEAPARERRSELHPLSPVRRLEARRRGVPGRVQAARRHGTRRAPLRERLRPAAGSARRGRGRRDLLRAARGGRGADDLRRRRADARLRPRGRRRGRHARRAARFGGRLQRRHRRRDDGQRAVRSSAATLPGRPSTPSTRRRARASSNAAFSTRPWRGSELGWEPAWALDDGLRSTWEWAHGKEAGKQGRI